MKRKRAKKTFNRKLLFLFIILVIAGVTLLLLNVKDKKTQPPPIQYSTTEAKDGSPTQTNRTMYDFKKILGEKFLTFENKEIGFDIAYPLEVRPSIYAENKAREKFGDPTLPEPVGAVNFSLISQPPGAYEIFDGLSLDIVYYENIWGQSFRNHIIQKGKEYNSETQSGTKFDGEININGKDGLKLIGCCYAGGSKLYYFPTNDNKYFVEISIFSIGPDKENFDQVADKMLNSLRIY